MESERLVRFFETVAGLKDTRRAGWVTMKVKNPESVADHSIMVSLLTLILARNRKNIDPEKAVKMAIVHDVVESLTGDKIQKEYWSGGDIRKRDKDMNELVAVKKLISILGDDEIFPLMKEFIEGKTTEAKFVYQIDKLEMILQSIKYSKEGRGRKSLEPFWDEKNLSRLKDPELREIAEKAIELL